MSYRSTHTHPLAPPHRSSRVSLSSRVGLYLGCLLAVTVVIGGCDRALDVDEIRRLQSRGQHAATLDGLRALLKERPEDAELNYLYGVALNRTESGRVSVWALRKAAEDPDWEIPARLELASAALASTNFEEAIAESSHILESNPDEETALMLRGTAYLGESGQADLALEDFERLLDLQPDNVSALSSRAQALLMLGETEAAEQAIVELQKKSGEREQTHFEAMLCITGAVLAAEKGAANTTDRFEACLDRFPETPIVVEQAIEYFDGIGDRKRATALLASLHAAMPGSQVYRKSLAARAVEEGDDARAEEILKSGTTRSDPRTRSSAWIDLTNFYLERDQLDAAIKAYEEALSLSPNPSQSAILQHADLLARAERHREALEVAGRLKEDAYRGLIEARVHLNEHRPAEALRRLEAVRATTPPEPPSNSVISSARSRNTDSRSDPPLNKPMPDFVSPSSISKPAR